MPIGPEYPTPETLVTIARDYQIDLPAHEAAIYADLMRGSIRSFRILDEMVEPKLPVKYKRDAGWRPAPEDNPLNAWLWRCNIEGAPYGILKDEKVAIKDVVCIAGLPQTNGTRLMDGYIADVDATIVTRILDAGGTIVGKTNTEDFSFAGSGHLCAHGPVKNPWNPDYNPGASSAGSAAAVGAGEVDLAIGGDQGGSIRIPAAWSGIYGLKATFGLVPYTGCGIIEMTMDHIGPMASSTRGIAKLLTAIAGFDPLDPRQRGVIGPDYAVDYMSALEAGVRGKRIGLVSEGFGIDGTPFGIPSSEKVVDDCVRDAARVFERLGAVVEEVSVPAQRTAPHVYAGIMAEGPTAFLINGNGIGSNWMGYYNTHMGEAAARGLKAHPHDIPHTVMLVMLTGEYMRRRYYGRYYGKAQNLRRTITEEFNRAFEAYDMLVMPTTPIRATKRIDRDAGIVESIGTAYSMLRNTCVADVTGHPSISIPCGMSGGLPIGMMITGRHLEEDTLIAASAAFEAAVDWKRM